MRCTKCGNVEKRKTAVDYGQEEVWQRGSAQSEN
jgi:hypothetical protein